MQPEQLGLCKMRSLPSFVFLQNLSLCRTLPIKYFLSKFKCYIQQSKNFQKFLIRFLILLFMPFCSFAQTSSSETDNQIQEAITVFEELAQSGNYKESLDMADLNNLPMGLSRTISNINYSIAICDYRVVGSYVYLNIFGKIIIPCEGKPDKTLFFAGKDIKTTFTGDIVGNAFLVLLGDVYIPINGDRAALMLKGNFDPNSGSTTSKTFIEMDCRGFKSLSISADVIFSEKFIRSVDASGNAIGGLDERGNPKCRVAASLETKVDDWNDILLSISLPPFEIVGLNGFIFSVKRAVFDLSDKRNETIVFPKDYTTKYLVPGNPELWKGVYIQELSVALPSQFCRKSSNERISFSANNMLLDNNGVSGLFSANNLLNIDQGSAGGWRFSVDQLSIELEANQLTGAGFAGKLGIPVSENGALTYNAFISPDNEYILTVQPAKNMKFDVLAAHVDLSPTSSVALKVVDGKFLPEVNLSGMMTIAVNPNGESDTVKPKISFKGIKFQNLHLQTVAPMLSVEYLGLDGEFKMLGLPLTISNIELKTSGQDVKLGFHGELILGVDKFELKANTHLEIVGEIKEDKGLASWKYKELKIDEIILDGSIAEVFSVKGKLAIRQDHPVYGDGVEGQISLKFDKVLDGLEIKARAIFGSRTYRYWLVDGMLTMPPPGITVFPPVNLRGFGGGAFMKMRQEGKDPDAPNGLAYVPDSTVGLGVKAAVVFDVANDKVVNCEASFEIAFNSSGGVNYIGFYGRAKVLGNIKGAENLDKFVSGKLGAINDKTQEFTKNNKSTVDQLEKYKLYEPAKASKEIYPETEPLGGDGFTAEIGIKYDFVNNVMHANMDMYINMLGGMMTGTSGGNKAGSAVIHIEKGKWYMHIGTPSNRMGVKINIANLVSMSTGTYFMIGDEMPDPPPPPKQVADILGVELSSLNTMRDLNAFAKGRGIAFGTDFRVATGDITALILYANFEAGLGFDIMMRNYADAQCEGRSGSIGMNGWYANGQAYAFLQGEMGVNVNLLFVKKKVPILKGASAMLLQAKLPNPAWFAGTMAVKFEVLDGLVKGSANLKIELGEECKIVRPGGSPLDVAVISDISPVANSRDVNVFQAPQVAFNMSIGKAFDVDENGTMKKYRLKLEEYSVSQNGSNLPGVIKWNETKDLASFYAHDILPPHTELKIFAKVTFEELTNNGWTVVYTGGKKAEEAQSALFTTGEAPDNIPWQNVAYTYPVAGQKFFYKNETSKGYIQLKQGQPYLFTSDYRFENEISGNDNSRQKVVFSYNAATKRIEFTMPNINNQQSYNCNFLSISSSAGTVGGDVNARTDLKDDDNDFSVRSSEAGSEVRGDAGKTLIEFSFSTSRYNTFAEKINNLQKDRQAWWPTELDVVFLQYSLKGSEGFDPVELVGSEFSGYKALIEPKAALDDDFYTKTIKPLIYEYYPINGLRFTHRNPDELGVPPAKAINVFTEYLDEVGNGNYSHYAHNLFPYYYNMAQAYKYDFHNMQNQVVNSPAARSSIGGQRLMAAYYPFISYGYYKTKFQYKFPDGSNGSAADFTYYHSATN